MLRQWSEAVHRMQPQLIEVLSRCHRPAVITQQRLALAVERLEHIAAVLGRAEAKAVSQLPERPVQRSGRG